MGIENGEDQNKKNSERQVDKKKVEQTQTEKDLEKKVTVEATEKSPKEYVFPDKATVPELLELGCDPEGADQADLWLKQIEKEEKERMTKLPEKPRECEAEIKELEELFISFEAKHSVIDLMLVTDPENPIQKPAQKDLEIFVKKLKILKEETNISTEKYNRLEEKYKYFALAVGSKNDKGKITHP